MVNRAQQFRSRTEGARKDRICQHCGKIGHLISTCWFLKDDGAKDGVVGTIVLALPVVRFETLRIGCGLLRTGGCEPDGSEGRGRE